jgi:hypothetical protein
MWWQDLLSTCEGASGPSRAPSERLEVRQSREGLTSDAETEATWHKFGDIYTLQIPPVNNMTTSMENGTCVDDLPNQNGDFL